ncbi:MAG: hypothetical protein ACYDC3_21065 [Candidatus Binataceae bacterium]
MATAYLLSAGPCWAAPSAGGLPWDGTMIVLQNLIIDSMAPVIIVLAFALAGILYALGGHDEQGNRFNLLDTRLSPELVNRKQFYVSISRARKAVAIYTNDRRQLPRALNRSREKSMAIEHQIGLRHSSFTVLPDEQRHTLNQGHGMRR